MEKKKKTKKLTIESSKEYDLYVKGFEDGYEIAKRIYKGRLRYIENLPV